MPDINQISNYEPWLQYMILSNAADHDDHKLHEMRADVLADERIRSWLGDLLDFHSILIMNHKNPELPIHKLHFLLDMGLDTDMPEINAAIDQIKAHKDENGVYQSRMNIPKHYGGTGSDMFAWCLCDAPLLLSALIKAGCDYESDVKQGVEHLASLVRANGFPCAVSPELGKFHGPGSKAELCPNATLQMLKLLALIPEMHNSPAANYCVEGLLKLWADSETRHPFQFYMGTDFRKLKAPMIWYDILSVASCLSYFEQARGDGRFQEMLAIIEQKRDADGMFVPEAVFLKYKGWEFGQKKNPSPYLTYLCVTLMERGKQL